MTPTLSSYSEIVSNRAQVTKFDFYINASDIEVELN